MKICEKFRSVKILKILGAHKGQLRLGLIWKLVILAAAIAVFAFGMWLMLTQTKGVATLFTQWFG